MWPLSLLYTWGLGLHLLGCHRPPGRGHIVALDALLPASLMAHRGAGGHPAFPGLPWPPRWPPAASLAPSGPFSTQQPGWSCKDMRPSPPWVLAQLRATSNLLSSRAGPMQPAHPPAFPCSSPMGLFAVALTLQMCSCLRAFASTLPSAGRPSPVISSQITSQSSGSLRLCSLLTPSLVPWCTGCRVGFLSALFTQVTLD